MEEKKEKRPIPYRAIVLCLIAVAAAVCIWKAALPREPARLDLSTSAWLDDYMEQVATPYKKDFTQSAAFSYQSEGGKIVLLYASMAEVGETRDFYKETYSAVERGRNDETALDLTMVLEDGDLALINYFSPVSRVFEMELRLKEEKWTTIATQVEEAFPTEAVETLLGETGLTDGAIHGGYVRYTYDDLDRYVKKGIPVFSRAYTYEKPQAEFLSVVDSLKKQYTQYSHDETQDAHYFVTADGVMAISLIPGEGEKQLVTVALQ